MTTCEHGIALVPNDPGYCCMCLRARLQQVERERDELRAELAALKAPKAGCPACHGRGHIYEGGHDGWVRCRECNGTGESPAKGGIAAVIGKWPGDESDAEIDEALREMS